MTEDAELQRLEARIEEGFADMAAALRDILHLLQRPAVASQPAAEARVMAALAANLDPSELPFKVEEVLDAAGRDHELAEALSALSLTTSAALGAWLRTRRSQTLAGYTLRRNERDRTWWLERATHAPHV